VKRQLTIVFFDAGGGPRGAAEALKSVLENHQRPWEVQLLTLQQKLDKLDLLRMLTGIRMQSGYNLILRNRWTSLHAAAFAGAREHHSYLSPSYRQTAFRLLEEQSRGSGAVCHSPFQSRNRREYARQRTRRAI
jgi:hypothetical protein